MNKPLPLLLTLALIAAPFDAMSQTDPTAQLEAEAATTRAYGNTLMISGAVVGGVGLLSGLVGGVLMLMEFFGERFAVGSQVEPGIRPGFIGITVGGGIGVLTGVALVVSGVLVRKRARAILKGVTPVVSLYKGGSQAGLQVRF